MKAAALISFAAIAVAAVLSSSAGAATPPTRSCVTQGGAGTAYAAGANCRAIAIDGYPRRYVVWVSPKARAAVAAGKRVPLVVMLHGSGGSGEKFLAISGWREKADAEGFVAAFPTGALYFVTKDGRSRWSTKWNDFGLVDDIDVARRPPGYPASAPWPANDTGFLRALIADVKRGLRIDAKRVYLSGFSNGGGMCARVGVEMSDAVAAVGCNAGGLDAVHPTTPGHPHVPMFVTVGNHDDRFVEALQRFDPAIAEIPLDPGRLLAIKPIAAWIGRHLTSIGLAQAPYTASTRGTSTELRWTTALAGNRDRNELRFLVLADLRHQYPNGRNNPNGFAMTSLLWPFFLAHPLR